MRVLGWRIGDLESVVLLTTGDSVDTRSQMIHGLDVLQPRVSL